MQELDLERFEELFKTRAQGPVVDVSCTKSKVAHKAANKVTLLDANRSKNLAITLRKANKTTEEICKAIEKYAPVFYVNFTYFKNFLRNKLQVMCYLHSGLTSRPYLSTSWSA